MPDASEQLKSLHLQRRQIRLAETKRRILRMQAMTKQRLTQRRDIRFAVTVDILDRAQKGCMAAQGLDLISWLRQETLAFADLVPRDQNHKLRLRIPSPEDEEWESVIIEFVADLDPDAELSVSDLLDMLDWPQASRGREALMRIGRIMRRLGWPRLRILRDGKRMWVYRKPLETMS